MQDYQDPDSLIYVQKCLTVRLLVSNFLSPRFKKYFWRYRRSTSLKTFCPSHNDLVECAKLNCPCKNRMALGVNSPKTNLFKLDMSSESWKSRTKREWRFWIRFFRGQIGLNKHRFATAVRVSRIDFARRSSSRTKASIPQSTNTLHFSHSLEIETWNSRRKLVASNRQQFTKPIRQK